MCIYLNSISKVLKPYYLGNTILPVNLDKTSWPLNNTGLKCMGPIIHGFLFSVSIDTYYTTTQSVVGWIQGYGTEADMEEARTQGWLWSYRWIFDCMGVGGPNPSNVQGSNVIQSIAQLTRCSARTQCYLAAENTKIKSMGILNYTWPLRFKTSPSRERDNGRDGSRHYYMLIGNTALLNFISLHHYITHV